MIEEQKKKIEINVHGGQVSMAFDKAHIDAKQCNGRDAEKDNTKNKISNKYRQKKYRRFLIVIIISVGIVSVLGASISGLSILNSSRIGAQQTNNQQSDPSINTSQQAENSFNDNNLYNNSLFLKANALLKQGKYLDAAVVYNELYGSLSNVKEYQLEIIKFYEANAYFCQFLLCGGVENKYRYLAIEIFEKIANTENKENEDLKLLSIGCLLILCNDLSDTNYEKKMVDYCKVLEEAIINYENISTKDYNTYSTLVISYYALAEYYQKQFAKGSVKDFSRGNLDLILYYYQEALQNCREMMKYELGIFDCKQIEITVLNRLSTYYPLFYFITKDEKYISAAESCFDEIKT